MPASTRVAIGIGILTILLVIVAALPGPFPFVPSRPGGQNRLCNSSFDGTIFESQGVLAGQNFMVLTNGDQRMECWVAYVRSSPPPPATDPSVVWFEFQGSPPPGVQAKRIVDLTGLDDQPPIGRISQTFDTGPGDSYEVSLTLINDPAFGPPSVTLTIGDGNPPSNLRPIGSFTGPRPVSGIQPHRVNARFRAASAKTFLEIAGDSPGNNIPIDHVVVQVLCPLGRFFCD
jgi:hypothetical protein